MPVCVPAYQFTQNIKDLSVTVYIVDRRGSAEREIFTLKLTFTFAAGSEVPSIVSKTNRYDFKTN